MKTSILSAVMFGVMVITTACSNEDDSLMTGMEKSESREACAPTTTVLVYMAGRNDLSGALMDDLSEIKRGSKNLRQNDNLIVFVRNNHEQQPWVARIKDGLVTDSVSLSDLGIRSSDGENRASDPAVMEGVMHYAFSHYPATSGNYGLVIEGHGCGWLMKQEVTENEAMDFTTVLDAKPYIKSTRFISKEEGTRDMKELLGDDFKFRHRKRILILNSVQQEADKETAGLPNAAEFERCKTENGVLIVIV